MNWRPILGSLVFLIKDSKDILKMKFENAVIFQKKNLRAGKLVTSVAAERKEIKRWK